MPALFVGERGTGKSLAIAHDSRQQRAAATIRWSTSIAPCRRAALESELFGDAIGTLHLADIEAMPLPLQTRLIRALSDADRGALERTVARARARVDLRGL